MISERTSDLRISIKNRMVGEGYPCYVVAEIGVNHDGSIEKAKKLIDTAAWAGVNAVKLQAYTPDCMIDHPIIEDLNRLIPRVDLKHKDILNLAEYAHSKRLACILTPFSRDAFRRSMYSIDAIKVGSGEMTNLPFLEEIAHPSKHHFGPRSNVPIIVSTGMSLMSEVELAVEIVRKGNPNVAVLVCASKYPAENELAKGIHYDLTRIKKFKDMFGVPVGLSDHHPMNWLSWAAVALGANIIEKHITLSHETEGEHVSGDHKMSLLPHELKELVLGIREIEQAMEPKRGLDKQDLRMRARYNHSVVSIKDIPKGKAIEESDVWVRRPGVGIPAMHLESVVGLEAKHDIEGGKLLYWEDFVL